MQFNYLLAVQLEKELWLMNLTFLVLFHFYFYTHASLPAILRSQVQLQKEGEVISRKGNYRNTNNANHNAENKRCNARQRCATHVSGKRCESVGIACLLPYVPVQSVHLRSLP